MSAHIEPRKFASLRTHRDSDGDISMQEAVASDGTAWMRYWNFDPDEWRWAPGSKYQNFRSWSCATRRGRIAANPKPAAARAVATRRAANKLPETLAILAVDPFAGENPGEGVALWQTILG